MRMWIAAGAVAALLGAPAVARAQRVQVQKVDGGFVDPLFAPPGAKAIVFVFTSTDCPISNRYAPELRRIVTAFACLRSSVPSP